MAARLQTAAGRLLLDGEIQGDGRKALGLTVAAVEGVYNAGSMFVSLARSDVCGGGSSVRIDWLTFRVLEKNNGLGFYIYVYIWT
jgi:hypothetical protein